MVLDVISFSLFFPISDSLLEKLQLPETNTFHILALPLSKAFESEVFWNGFLSTMYGLIQCIMAPIHGRWSDRFGRKPVLVVSLYLLMFANTLMAFQRTFSMLFITKVITGVTKTLSSLSYTISSDMSEAKISDKGNAIIGIAYSIGFTIGPLVGILLVRKNNVVYDSFMVAALLNFISLLVCMFFEEKRNETTNNQNEDNDGHPTQSRNQRDYFLVALLFQFFYSGFESTLTFSAKERLNFNSREQGMLLIWIGVASIIIHGVFMRRKKQFDDNTVVNIGIIGALCSAILFPFAKTTNQAYVTVLGSSIATSFVNGGLSRLVVIKADSKFKGEQIGKMRKYSQLGRALGPFCASFICSSFGYHSYGFFSSTGLVVTALFLNHVFINRRKFD